MRGISWTNRKRSTHRDRAYGTAQIESPEDRERERLRKRVAELEQLVGRQAAEIDFQRCLAKSRGATPEERRQWRRGIYEQIRVMQSQGVLSIERMCQASGISRAGFYRSWEEQEPDQAVMALRDAIQRTSLDHPRYGAAKVAELLRSAGWVVSVPRVQRVRREDNLLAVRRRKFVVTTDSDHDFLVYPNLAQYMVLTEINQLWVDITYMRLASEFVYFAVVLDAFSRRALGWSVGPSLHAALPLAALNRAMDARSPASGPVHHSDRGSQYASNEYVRRLEECQITISMRPAGAALGKCALRTLHAHA